ncbi:hypothetical protein HXV90_02985 [Lysinibacillus sp. JK80]|uniref:hypothetical protein n=1 Tax=Lysinibacillus sp. JK80 TaxID=2749809 RepID=UPI0022B9B188|nr:hypothetical protein [Lysinibacillus sp. JK80]WBF54890.1 hypothetical protein HXV90_02985 [Lysinibacillus sp. JK80]
MHSNNRENAILQIRNFLDSDSEKVVLIKGTHQYAKHSLVLRTIYSEKGFKNGLYRTNSLQHVSDHLEQAGFKLNKKSKITSGKTYNFGNINLYFDSLNTKSTWRNTPNNLDFALVYPIDSFSKSNTHNIVEFINDILSQKNINKIFIVTWTDIKQDYSWLEQYVDRTITFDVEEEDPEYHQRMLDLE